MSIESGSATDKNADIRHHTGDDVRALRKARGMTIVELADRVGRSIGWLSHVERGQANPSIPVVAELAKVFEVPISFFFRNEMSDEAERGFVVRKQARASLGTRQDGLVEELLSPDLSGDFEVIHSTFEPHRLSGWIDARPTQEAGYMISGRLTLEFADRKFELNAGDSFQFHNEQYRWNNQADEPAVAVWVISPPVY